MEEGEENRAIQAKMNRVVEQDTLAGMVVEEAAYGAREGRVVRVFSLLAERVVDKVNPILLNRMWEGPMGEVLAQEGEALEPPVVWVLRVRDIRHLWEENTRTNR